MLFVCKCGGRQFAICFLAPPHPKPVTAILYSVLTTVHGMYVKVVVHIGLPQCITHIYTHTHTHLYC